MEFRSPHEYTSCLISNDESQTQTVPFNQLQFLCEEGSGDYIARVDEPQSCRYVLTIHTSRTCQHPFLRPPSTAKPQDIVCQPALSAQQYMDYVKAQVCKLTKTKVIVMQYSKQSSLLSLMVLYVEGVKGSCPGIVNFLFKYSRVDFAL